MEETLIEISQTFCCYVHMVLRHNAVIVFSSKSDSADKTEV